MLCFVLAAGLVNQFPLLHLYNTDDALENAPRNIIIYIGFAFRLAKPGGLKTIAP